VSQGVDTPRATPYSFLERNILKLLYAFLGIAAVLVAAGLALSAFRPVQVVPRYSPLPPFRLVDHRGVTFDEGSLIGRFTLFSFMATQGDAASRETLSSLQKLKAELSRTDLPKDKILMATVTLDPEQDTPLVLAQVALQQKADPRQWLFLTGDPASIYDLATLNLGIFYRKDRDPAGPTVVHTSRFVLVDHNAVVRSSYEGPSLDVGRVIRDLKLMDDEASAQGASRYVYEAAHLLLCYPR
jgi:protein SCO1/2